MNVLRDKADLSSVPSCLVPTILSKLRHSRGFSRALQLSGSLRLLQARHKAEKLEGKINACRFTLSALEYLVDSSVATAEARHYSMNHKKYAIYLTYGDSAKLSTEKLGISHLLEVISQYETIENAFRAKIILPEEKDFFGITIPKKLRLYVIFGNCRSYLPHEYEIAGEKAGFEITESVKAHELAHRRFMELGDISAYDGAMHFIRSKHQIETGHMAFRALELHGVANEALHATNTFALDAILNLRHGGERSTFHARYEKVLRIAAGGEAEGDAIVRRIMAQGIDLGETALWLAKRLKSVEYVARLQELDRTFGFSAFAEKIRELSLVEKFRGILEEAKHYASDFKLIEECFDGMPKYAYEYALPAIHEGLAGYIRGMEKFALMLQSAAW